MTTRRSTPDERDADGNVVIRVGPEEVVVRRVYQTLSIANDFLIGIWFLVGSICFFWSAWEVVGVWLFILGSAQLIVRPSIRLAHRIHLRHVPPGSWEL